MTLLGLTFITPLLLLGTLSAGIPVILHLLTRARAAEVPFPTLRLLRAGMVRTARRRKVQHWLLLALRSTLLMLLAISVAEPVSRSVSGWIAGTGQAVVILLDNSLSMAATDGKTTSLAQAKIEAATLLGGDDKPSLAAFINTTGSLGDVTMSDHLDSLRRRLDRTAISYAQASLGPRLAQAVRALNDAASPHKTIYLLSDLQTDSFSHLPGPDALAGVEDLQIMLIDTGRKDVNNVGIEKLAVDGLAIVDQEMRFTATLVNSSATERVIDVSLQVDNGQVGSRVRLRLGAAGTGSSTAEARFRHIFRDFGWVSGQVVIDQADDLDEDNVRRFALHVGPVIRSLIVRRVAEPSLPAALDATTMLEMALDPYGNQDKAWSIVPSVVGMEQFSAADLRECDVAFFCGVPGFSEAQGRAIESFVRRGGAVAFFLGERVDIDSYNFTLIEQAGSDGPLLPLRLEEVTGQLGPAAPSIQSDWIDIDHPLFSGLYAGMDTYPRILVQRYFRLSGTSRLAHILIRLANGDPLLAERRFGLGTAMICATGASAHWSDLPATGLFLPMVVRFSLQSRQGRLGKSGYEASSKVSIRPLLERSGPGAIRDPKEVVVVFPPSSTQLEAGVAELPIHANLEGAVTEFTQTDQPGFYRWNIAGATESDGRPGGVFAVNAYGPESRLQKMPADEAKAILLGAGVKRVHLAESIAEARRAATAEAEGRNWWDLLLAAAIVILIAEATVANRLGLTGQATASAIGGK